MKNKIIPIVASSIVPEDQIFIIDELVNAPVGTYLTSTVGLDLSDYEDHEILAEYIKRFSPLMKVLEEEQK